MTAFFWRAEGAAEGFVGFSCARRGRCVFDQSDAAHVSLPFLVGVLRHTLRRCVETQPAWFPWMLRWGREDVRMKLENILGMESTGDPLLRGG